MEFLSDWVWWGLMSCAFVASVGPAFIQRIRLPVLAAIALFYLTMVSAMYCVTGMVSAIAGTVITLFAGMAALLASLIVSGIGTMLKKRYR